MGFFDHLYNRLRPPRDTPLGIPGDWERIDTLSDEFEGAYLDTSKWEPFNRNWKGRAPGWFNPANVTVSQGAMILSSTLQPPPPDYPADYHTFATSFVRSKAMMGYGLVEAALQTADSVTSSSFWLVHNTPRAWNEIDVFESSQAGRHQCRFNMNAHVFKKDGNKLEKALSFPSHTELGFNLCQRVFTAAFLRTPSKCVWYVDGEKKKEIDNEHWHDDMFVQFDCETMPNWFGLPCLEEMQQPKQFKVYGVRSWKSSGGYADE